MKVYLDGDLPKSCKDCFFCEHIEEDIDGKGRDEVACYFEGFLNNVLLGETFNAKHCHHLQSLAEHDKQVRKEVCNEIRKMLPNYIYSFQEPEVPRTKVIELEDVKYILDQIQGE